MTSLHVLIVEDEIDISDLLSIHFRAQGANVTIKVSGSDAIDYIQTPLELRDDNFGPVNIFVLDRMIPGANGLEVCQFIRMYKQTKYCPILMVTALSTPEHIVEGLNAGADDYITKPFDISVLIARYKSLVRRVSEFGAPSLMNQNEKKSLFHLGPLKLDTCQCKIWLEDRQLDLTLSEYKLLSIFMSAPGKVMTRNHLISSIQDGPIHVTDRTIDTHVFGLRKKLGVYSQIVETIRGIGYRVNGEI